MAKKEMPEKIKKFHKQDERIDNLVKSTELMHNKVFADTADEFLPKTEYGTHDWTKLDDKEFREKFKQELKNRYVTEVKKQLKIGEDKGKGDDMYNNRLLHGFAGVTEKILGDNLETYRSDYTSSVHAEIRGEHVKKVDQELRPLAHQHLDRKDLSDIVEFTKTTDSFDPDKMEVEHGAIVLRDFKKMGAVPVDKYKRTPFYKENRYAA